MTMDASHALCELRRAEQLGQVLEGGPKGLLRTRSEPFCPQSNLRVATRVRWVGAFSFFRSPMTFVQLPV